MCAWRLTRRCARCRGIPQYHAVQEEGVALREIAKTIGKGLEIPVVTFDKDKAAQHFPWLAHFAGLDMPASSEWTRETLGLEPHGAELDRGSGEHEVPVTS